MEINEFNKGKYSDFGAETTIWGNKRAMVVVDCFHTTFEEVLPLVNDLLRYIEDEKSSVIKGLIDEDILGLAKDWVESGEEAEDSTEERRCFLLTDGTKVCLPIAEQDFVASLRFVGLNIYYEEKKADISAAVYIECEPDYFAGHSIEILMDGKGNIRDIGLIG